MATVRATINTALRKLGRLASGREPRPVDQEDAFEAFKGTLRYLITSGAFGRLCETVPLSDYTARPNERIFVQDDTIVITLPDLVQYGYGGPWDYGRPLPYPYSPNQTARDYAVPPRDGSVVVIVDQETGVMNDFIYDGTIKQWMGVNSVLLNVTGASVQPMTIDSQAPMSTRDPQGLAALLATRIADDWGADLAPSTIAQAQHFTSSLVSGFSFPRREAVGSYM